jgi:hypothetical protein
MEAEPVEGGEGAVVSGVLEGVGETRIIVSGKADAPTSVAGGGSRGLELAAGAVAVLNVVRVEDGTTPYEALLEGDTAGVAGGIGTGPGTLEAGPN